MNEKLKRLAKVKDCAVVIGSKEKPIVMEVIGKNGLKVAEYVDMGDKKRPYYVLNERVINDI